MTDKRNDPEWRMMVAKRMDEKFKHFCWARGCLWALRPDLYEYHEIFGIRHEAPCEACKRIPYCGKCRTPEMQEKAEEAYRHRKEGSWCST